MAVRKLKREILITLGVWIALSALLILRVVLEQPSVTQPIEELEKNQANVIQVEGVLNKHTVGGRHEYTFIRFVAQYDQIIDLTCDSLQEEFCDKQINSIERISIGAMPVRMTLVKYGVSTRPDVPYFKEWYWPIYVESGGKILMDRAQSYRRYKARVIPERERATRYILAVLFAGACTLLGYFGYKIISKFAEGDQ